jgi:branched-chain amino acid transport system substrate-binding protein
LGALVGALLLLQLLVGCSSLGVPPKDNAVNAATEPVKVGAIFDLTGATSEIGKPYADGVRAYVDWFNNNRDANKQQIQLIANDYAFKTENAERLYSQYVNSDKVVAIVGWGTADTEALKDKITRDHLPFVSGSLSESLTDVQAFPYNFVVGVNYSDQMRIVLQHIVQQENNARGIKIAFLFHDGPFGKAPEPALDEVARKHGMAVLKIPMLRGATTMLTEMQQVKNFAPTYVIIQNTPGPATLALRDGQQVGLDTQYVMLNFAANENFIRQANDLAEGVIGALPFATPTEGLPAVKTINGFLASKNRGSLNDIDKGLVFSQGWTIMSVMAEGIKRAAAKGQVTGDAIKAELEALQNFDTGGITTPITFGPDDHQGTTALQLYQVREGQWEALTELLEAQR